MAATLHVVEGRALFCATSCDPGNLVRKLVEWLASGRAVMTIAFARHLTEPAGAAI